MAQSHTEWKTLLALALMVCIGVLVALFAWKVGHRIWLVFARYSMWDRSIVEAARRNNLDPRIVKDLIERPELVASAGERRVMTVMFCDIAGFTTMSERMAPAELLVLLNRYFSLMSQAVGDNGGVIDKYIGDAVMAFWGAPFCDASEQGLLAARAALAGAAAVASLRADAPGANVRFGVATGEVVVGNIGSETTRSYTVIGDAVNLASRLEGANKAYGSGNLISKPTADMIAGAMELREIDTIVVPGKSQAKRVYEILGARGAVAPRRLELRDAYAAGLEAYRREAWAEARKAFEGGLTLDPGDGPAKVMAARAAAFQDAPPARPWDGTWVVTQK